MKCEQCVKENKKSQIRVGLGYTTAVYYPCYYDEEGNLHQHDGNITTTQYTCSNGHTWAENGAKSLCPTCGADW